MHHVEDPTWKLIRRLGYAGLIPFVFLALCLWLVGSDLHPYVALSMQGYGGDDNYSYKEYIYHAENPPNLN